MPNPRAARSRNEMAIPPSVSQRGGARPVRPTRERVDEGAQLGMPAPRPLEDDQDYGPERM